MPGLTQNGYQEVKPEPPSRRAAENSNGVWTRWLPKDYKQTLDAIQRLACMALAIGTYIHTGNLGEFIVILAVSHIDPRGAKDLLAKVLRAIIT